MVSKQLLRALAVLGIRLTHSRPGQPAGRGKIERFFRTVREQFLLELTVPGAASRVTGLAELNELFTAWVETVYHQRVHSETGQAPLARFLAAGTPATPTPAQLREAFLWSEHRAVTKTATVSLHGNTYEVDAALTGRTMPRPWWIECSWVIRPPTRVHLSVGSTAAISATFGHGSGQPPRAAAMSMVGRSMPGFLRSDILAEQLQPAGQYLLSHAAFARVEGGGGVDSGEGSAEGPQVRDEVNVHVGGAQGYGPVGVLA